MCGIVGITGKHPDLVRSMADALAHRGPDGEGFFVDDQLSLGHRRLAVLDLSPRGHQPMEHGDLVIAYNGEVYNFRSIRTELEAHGHAFTSECDTEVLLHAYEQWGASFLERLNGMFALAIYNRRTQDLFLARDRLGIKPLYYFRQGKEWMFASEIKALLPALPSRTINKKALVDYLTYRFVPNDVTLLDGVCRLPPAHYLALNLDSGTHRIERYWKLEYGHNGHSLSENAAQVRELLKDAVRSRLISDVPLGVYLSGGLDSSALVACVANESDRPVNTFTVAFDDARFSEAKHARLVAERFGTKHHEIRVTMRAVELLPEVVRHLDEPIGDAATLPTYAMARETKKHATVALSGEGSDELFAGYSKYLPLYYSRFLPTLPTLARSGKAARLNALWDRQASRKYRRFAAVFSDLELTSLLNFPLESADRFELAPYFDTGNSLHDLLNLDTATWLPNDLFVKGDKMTMAHGVEARVPFMDHRLVEFAATIPAEQKLAWGKEKRVYRKAIAPLLPPEIVRRRKQGFTIPLNTWLREGLRDYALDTLRAVDLPELRTDAMESVLLRPSHDVFTRRQFWTILFLLAWHQEFLFAN